MVSLDKAILLGVMRVTDEHGDSQTVTKAHQGGGKIATLGGSHPSGITIQVIEAGNPCSANVCATAARAVSACKIGADMVSHQHRGTFIDDIECFHHMLLFAMRIGRDAGGVFEVQLPMLHRCWSFKWLGHSGEARSNASVFRSTADEQCGSISAAASLSRLHPD